MLPEKRRWLHLKVAHVIETLFQERLHEFYGILSYHFNQDADFEKALRKYGVKRTNNCSGK